MARSQILEVIRGRDALRLRSTQKVLLDWVGVVAKADFDWAVESMDISVVARALRK